MKKFRYFRSDNNRADFNKVRKINFRKCEIDGEMMKVISKSLVFMKHLKILNLWGKDENKIDNMDFGDEGCNSVFNNAKYITELEKLNLGECEITSESSEVMYENMKHLNKLREINLKNNYNFENEGCKAILNSAKYLANLEKLNLWNCGITSELSEVINISMKYFHNLKEIFLGSKNENNIDNSELGDEGFKALFNNAKYLSNI